MIGSLAGAAKSLGLRFTFAGILPFALLGVFSVALAFVARADQNAAVLDVLEAGAAAMGAGGWIAVLLVAFVIAVAAEPLQVAFVRFLEGYWGASPGTRHLRNIATELQRRRSYRLARAVNTASDAKDWQRVQYLEARQRARPRSDEDLLPTKLGNVLRASERRAGERYGLDTTLSWPRLFSVVSPELRAAVGELHGQIDAGARMASTFAIGAVAAAPVFGPRGWWNLATVGLLAAAMLAYVGTVNAAQRLAPILETAYDLHRFDMLTALHLPLPHRPFDEREKNAVFTEFLAGYENAPLPAREKYAHPRT